MKFNGFCLGLPMSFTLASGTHQRANTYKSTNVLKSLNCESPGEKKRESISISDFRKTNSERAPSFTLSKSKKKSAKPF
jgi:hypothetical protein